MSTKNVDISGFAAVVQGLANITGKSFKETLGTEVSMVLRGAAMKVKVASVGGKMSKGRLRGGIVPYNMPKGLKHTGHDGHKLITKKDGKYYHIGEPVIIGRQPNHSNINLPKGAKRRGGKKRGGKIYAHPYPNLGTPGRRGQAWLKNRMFGQYVPDQYRRTTDKIKHRGITAGQFAAMAQKAGLKFRVQGLGKDKYKAMTSSAVQRIVGPRSRGKNTFQKFQAAIEVGSSGIRMSAKRGVQHKLMLATRARVNLYKNQAVKKGFINDMKHWMPSRYPLLFGK